MKLIKHAFVLLLVFSVFGCVATRDGQLVEDGFQKIADDDIAGAEVDFRDALSANGDNAYAMFNLGWVYEATGRTQQARRMYNRVISRDGDEVAEKATEQDTGGRKLVDLAREQLAGL